MKSVAMLVLVMLVLLSLLAAPDTLTAGEFRVYDADGQFLGISLDRNPGQTDTIYIPDLDLTTTIVWYDDAANPLGKILQGHFHLDASNNPYLKTAGRIFRGPDCGTEEDHFCVGAGTPTVVLIERQQTADCNVYVTEGETMVYGIKNIPASDIPFTMPVAIPLEYRYCAQSDLDCDSDVDGSDLAGFATHFGKPAN